MDCFSFVDKSSFVLTRYVGVSVLIHHANDHRGLAGASVYVYNEGRAFVCFIDSNSVASNFLVPH